VTHFESTSADMSQVIETFLPAYRQRYRLTPDQASVCQSIVQCQTENLGGENSQCTACGYEQQLYHSCGNRHCPRCKQKASERWENKQLDALLPVRYYHLVFTLPHEFNAWCQLHPKEIYALFFKAIWQTLSLFSTTHKRLRGQLGVTCVLHTWGQNLQQHVHIHCLIPGLALKEGYKTIETTQSDYLYPVNALKKVFRGKMVSLLRHAYQQGELYRITRDNEVNTVLDKVMRKKWSIYIKPYLEHPETVVALADKVDAVSPALAVAITAANFGDFASQCSQLINAFPLPVLLQWQRRAVALAELEKTKLDLIDTQSTSGSVAINAMVALQALHMADLNKLAFDDAISFNASSANANITNFVSEKTAHDATVASAQALAKANLTGGAGWRFYAATDIANALQSATPGHEFTITSIIIFQGDVSLLTEIIQ